MEILGFGDRLEVSEYTKEPDKPFMAIWAVDRQAMIDLLDKCTALQRKKGGEVIGFTITMPCGYSQRFTNNCDIPFEDLPCYCGQEDHYLIQYKKE